MSDAAYPKPDTEQQVEPMVLGAEETPKQEPAVEAAAVNAAAGNIEETSTEPPAAEAEAVPVEATATPEPVKSEPAPEPPASTAPVDIPTVASTLEVPASPQVAIPAADQDGGEWELLVEKVRTWISSGQLHEQWQSARTPLSLLAGLIAVLLVLRVYSAVLGVLDSIPLLPGLLELAGLVAVVQFSLTRLVRSNDRREVIEGVKQRWQSFRGRG
ncbi:CAAD domain-containing protein [Vulcanococcus sp.]|jgi:hypothetical protein|uniref:CAAD domain-containing protein n=1 Tax=Vulcanococcus sp. TaxID=2856995 RepID=UPI0037D9F0DD